VGFLSIGGNMISFLRDDEGCLILAGYTEDGVALYTSECRSCHKIYNLSNTKKSFTAKCTCEREDRLLTIGGVTKSITDWCIDNPTVSESSVYQRFLSRKAGKLELSDVGVLFGKRKETEVLHVEPISKATWERELADEINARISSMPLMTAIIQAVKLVSPRMSFVQEVTMVYKEFSAAGVDYTIGGTTLPELFTMYDNDIDAIIMLLHGEGLTDTEISKLVNLGE
jgi:hypothetical protein